MKVGYTEDVKLGHMSRNMYDFVCATYVKSKSNKPSANLWNWINTVNINYTSISR